MSRSFLLATSVLALAPSAHALDRFEIQVYDGQTNVPGVLSLENHVNLIGQGARTSPGPELPTNHQLHWTFEGALGATGVWEPGIYVQTALLPDGTVAFGGMKLRSKFTAAPLLGGRLRLAANLELADVPRRFEQDQWSVEVRPIAALAVGPWRIALNPILGVPLTSGASENGPHFEPAASVKGLLSEHAALGVEYYGDFGPILAPEPAIEQQHYLFAAGDYDLGRGVALNVGIGGGIAGQTDALVAKVVVGFELARLWGSRE